MRQLKLTLEMQPLSSDGGGSRVPPFHAAKNKRETLEAA